MLFATTCAICGAAGPAPCATCRAALRPAPPGGADGVRALLAYEGAGRELVARLKYRNARSSIGWLAKAMAELIAADEVDVVTWAPTSPERRRTRGFDQAELLARAVGRRLGLPCRALLTRLPGPAQTGRTRPERRAGPRFAPYRRARRRSLPGRVLLVDDVVTTGATLAAARGALRAAGVGSVIALVAARTAPTAAGAASSTIGGTAPVEGATAWRSPSAAATPRCPTTSEPSPRTRSAG